MTSAIFEGSYLGDATRIADDTRLECGICWTVYDPAAGDPVWQIAAGTAFSALPEHWRCPTCDATKDKFMVLGSAGSRRPIVAEAVAPEAADAAAIDAAVDAGAVGDEVRRAYGRAADAMRDLAVYNPKLGVFATPFRRHGDVVAGVVSTPWCMNIVAIPDSTEGARVTATGTKRKLDFPSGRYEFIRGYLDGVGAVELCSLFSPMAEFEDDEAARLAATAAADALFEPDPEAAPPPPPPEAPKVDRRALFFGREAR